MSQLRKVDLYDPSRMFIHEKDTEYSLIYGDQELFLPKDIFHGIFSHIQRPPISSHYQRIQSLYSSEPFMQRMSYCLFCLEAVCHDPNVWVKDLGHGKCTWTAEVEHGDRKYKWTTKIKCADNHGKKKGHNFVEKINAGKLEQIQYSDQPGDVFKQALGKRRGTLARAKGKRKALSAEDAAAMIQLEFRKYLIRRSKTLRALRELAAVKAKVKEIKLLFSSFSCRQKMKIDREERLKFSERIIALLLTVVSIEGADLMVRSARKSMLDELEEILDAVDPQPPGKLDLLGRRMF